MNDGRTVCLEHEQATVRQFAAVDRVVVEWHLFMQSGKGVAVTGCEGRVEMRLGPCLFLAFFGTLGHSRVQVMNHPVL